MELEKNIIEKVEETLKTIINEGIQPDNLDYVSKLVDIHKDIKNEEYWKVKEENYMRYRNYGTEYGYGEESYGRRTRDSRGRYAESSYGRRGVPGSGRGRYRGEEMMDDMYSAYGEYSDSRERYGAGDSKAFDYMLQSVEDFMMMLKDDASSQEEVEKIKRTARKISEM